MKTRLLSSLKSSSLALLGALSIGVLVCSTSYAQNVSGTNVGDAFITIPENSFTGVTSTVTITEAETIESARFSIEGLQHSWIGDLIVTVSNLNTGASATLFNRIGANSPNSRGFNTNLNGTYTFADGNGSLESNAANGDTNFEIPAIAYDATGVLGAPVSLNSAFAGTSTLGDWQFNIIDFSEPDNGFFTGVTVEFETTAVPEPGTMATIVMGTLFGGVYLRRRHSKKKPQQESDESVA